MVEFKCTFCGQTSYSAYAARDKEYITCPYCWRKFRNEHYEAVSKVE